MGLIPKPAQSDSIRDVHHAFAARGGTSLCPPLAHQALNKHAEPCKLPEEEQRSVLSIPLVPW
jgi:hypothetical protein